jgi:hypothetical protein
LHESRRRLFLIINDKYMKKKLKTLTVEIKKRIKGRFLKKEVKNE